jgi:putative resolvase
MYMIAKGYSFEVITDIGSGFELVENFEAIFGCEIEIIDNTEKTEEQELVEALIQIVTVFSCRLQGKRANKAKRMIKELLADNSSEKSKAKANTRTRETTLEIRRNCTLGV